MKKEEQQYYDNYLDLFLHPGWKQLQESLETTAEQLRDITTIRDQRDLDFRQGQLANVTTLLTFEGATRATLDALEAEDAV